MATTEEHVRKSAARLDEENSVDAIELDGELFSIAQIVLQEAIVTAAEHNIHIHLRLFQADFVLNGLHFLRPSLLETPVGQGHYHHIIANPPYFKMQRV